MTNYNDGKWHGWNGGECPVHPKSRVEWWGNDLPMSGSSLTKYYRGSGPAAGLPWDTLVAFRVVKEHREPREWWLKLDVDNHIRGWDISLGNAPPPNWAMDTVILVREVIE